MGLEIKDYYLNVGTSITKPVNIMLEALYPWSELLEE